MKITRMSGKPGVKQREDTSKQQLILGLYVLKQIIIMTRGIYQSNTNIKL